MKAKDRPEDRSQLSVTTGTSVPAADREPTRPYRWQPNPRNVRALDRHIAVSYGDDVAARYGVRYW